MMDEAAKDTGTGEAKAIEASNGNAAQPQPDKKND
jgi:hypothetical protein